MNSEFKRMMKLAGLTEIKVNHPISYRKLNLPPDFLEHADTLIDIPELEENYNGLTDSLVQLNPQIDSYFFQIDNSGLFDDVMDAIEYDHPDGVTLRQFYEIYFTWLFANLIYDPNKYNDEELEARQETFNHPDQRQEFANNALEGRWLNIAGVTS
jgi:hypothetical protein